MVCDALNFDAFKKEKFKIDIGNLATVLCILFLHSIPNDLSRNLFALLDCLIIKRYFESICSLKEEHINELTKVYKKLETKFDDVEMDIDECLKD